MVASSEIVIQNCARFSTGTQLLFKIEKTRRNRLCLSWLSDIYGRVEYPVYKIRFALRTLKVIGVKKKVKVSVMWSENTVEPGYNDIGLYDTSPIT